MINVKTGLVLGGYSRRGHGWGFTPYTSAHGGSRKAHATKSAASLRYATPYCVDVEAETPAAAAKIAQERKALFEAWAPCNGCAMAIKATKDPDEAEQNYHCAAGAATSLARTLQFCAKFLSEKQAVDLEERCVVDAPITDQEITGQVEVEDAYIANDASGR
jgi:hypothetical protein